MGRAGGEEKIHEVLSNNKEGRSQGRLPGISGYRVQLFRKKKMKLSKRHSKQREDPGKKSQLVRGEGNW